jgi:hypothetical protein
MGWLMLQRHDATVQVLCSVIFMAASQQVTNAACNNWQCHAGCHNVVQQLPACSATKHARWAYGTSENDMLY